jgi:membrane protein DedA with SNARE-associated domain
VGGIEQSILNFINSVYTTIQWPGVIALMAIESACVPLPSEIIMPLAGWMLIKAVGDSAGFNLVAGVYGAIGCVIGSVVAYWVGMRGGRPFLNRYGRYILINPDDLERADRWFARNGDWAIFITRLLPVVRTFISFPAGIARMPFWRFVIYTFVGSFIWCAALAFAGYLLGEHWEEIRRWMRPFDPFIIAVIVLAVAYYVYRHVRHARRRRPASNGS